MTKDEMDKIAETLRNQGLTLGQTMFAVSLVLEAIQTEREACAIVCDDINAKYKCPEDTAERVASQWCADSIRARGQA